MNEFNVRQASKKDTRVIGELLNKFNREYDEPTPEPEELAKRIGEMMDNGDTKVILAGNPGYGVAVLRLRKSIWVEGLECYLAELYVLPEERGHGIGRAIMNYVLKLAKSEGAEYIDLNTAETDVAARHLYESLGFSRSEGKPDGPINYYYEREL